MAFVAGVYCRRLYHTIHTTAFSVVNTDGSSSAKIMLSGAQRNQKTMVERTTFQMNKRTKAGVETQETANNRTGGEAEVAPAGGFHLACTMGGRA